MGSLSDAGAPACRFVGRVLDGFLETRGTQEVPKQPPRQGAAAVERVGPRYVGRCAKAELVVMVVGHAATYPCLLEPTLAHTVRHGSGRSKKSSVVAAISIRESATR